MLFLNLMYWPIVALFNNIYYWHYGSWYSILKLILCSCHDIWLDQLYNAGHKPFLFQGVWCHQVHNTWVGRWVHSESGTLYRALYDPDTDESVHPYRASHGTQDQQQGTVNGFIMKLSMCYLKKYVKFSMHIHAYKLCWYSINVIIIFAFIKTGFIIWHY